MHVIVARCLQTQSILNRLTIEQWSTIEKSPFSEGTRANTLAPHMPLGYKNSLIGLLGEII